MIAGTPGPKPLAKPPSLVCLDLRKPYALSTTALASFSSAVSAAGVGTARAATPRTASRAAKRIIEVMARSPSFLRGLIAHPPHGNHTTAFPARRPAVGG